MSKKKPVSGQMLLLAETSTVLPMPIGSVKCASYPMLLQITL